MFLAQMWLLTLVSVPAQSLFTLVSSHLVALVLLSVRHNFYRYLLLMYNFQCAKVVFFIVT